MDAHSRPVFFDPTRRRAARLAGVAAVLALIAAAVLGAFAFSVFVVPVAWRVRLPLPRYAPDRTQRVAAGVGGGVAPAAPAAEHHRGRRHEHGAVGSAPVPGRAHGVVGGFYVSWNEASLASLRLHAPEMTHLFPGWLTLGADGGSLLVHDDDPQDAAAKAVAVKNRLAVVPLLNNFRPDSNTFDDRAVHELVSDPARRARVAAALRDYLVRNHYQGVNLDLETDDEADRALLPAFTADVARALRPAGLLVTQDVQVGQAAVNARIAASCDFVVPMIYDLHYAGGPAGPIAPVSWVGQQLDELLRAHVPADKIVLAVGSYGYDWRRGDDEARSLTFGEAMAIARESHDGDVDGVVRFDADSANPTFTYHDEDDALHRVWLLDAVADYDIERAARARGVDGRALWYVGSEDPTLWSFFGKGRVPRDPSALRAVRYGFEIDFEGEGEILDVSALPEPGSRELTVAADGRITGEHFTSYPTACILRRSGKVKKEVALTFDDGPDPRWTPQILDELGRLKAPGTFFVIGSMAEQRPDLLRRMWAEGHDIGNHSFYHPNLADTPGLRTRVELDATQRAVEAATGRSTPLFRPPYGVDSEPSTTAEVTPIEEAKELGYVTVGEGVDPHDWEAQARHLTPQQIADDLVRQVEAGRGNVVLLHDAGGDRSATVAALPLAIPRLCRDGYKFVTVSQLIGRSDRAAFFPAVPAGERALLAVDGLVFGASTWAGRTLTGLFLFSLAAGAVRLFGVSALAVVHARAERRREAAAVVTSDAALPAVSVVIAAYNEEKVIARTVHALLCGDYPDLEVLVVDDGSKDDTAGVVEREFGADPRVRLIKKPNGGKASALNLGIAEARGSVLVGLDADTLFLPDTVRRMARHFAADPTVGAVAGNVHVGNRGSGWLTRWQSLEYTTGQNFDRRAYAVLNGIPVVPGAVGAWRATAVREAGGYATDTLAEDADLTWRVRRAGWRVLSDSTAHAYTEAPERLRDLMKQRFRWTFGTLQTLWKHRDLLFQPRARAFGCLVAPSLWFFQILLPLAAPAADLGALLALLTGNLPAMLAYGGFFFAVEFGAACLAYALDPAPEGKAADLWHLPAQRLLWRYCAYVTLLRSLGTALKGSRAGWGKLERRGTATVAGAAGKTAAPAA